MDILKKLKLKLRFTFANPKPEEYQDAAIIQKEQNAYGTILGQLDREGKYPIVFREDGKNRLNRNILATGAADRVSSFVKSYIFQAVKRRESMVISDPDGNLHASVALSLAKQGYHIHVMDLSRPAAGNALAADRLKEAGMTTWAFFIVYHSDPLAQPSAEAAEAIAGALEHYAQIPPFEIPVNFILHDMAGAAPIRALEKHAATSRRNNIRLCMTVGAMDQLAVRYEWQALASNCSTILVFGNGDEIAKEMVAKWMGPDCPEFATDEVLHEDSVGILMQFHDPIIAWDYPFDSHSASKERCGRHPYPMSAKDLIAYQEKCEEACRAFLDAHPAVNEEIDRSYFFVCESMFVPSEALTGGDTAPATPSKKLLTIGEPALSNLAAVSALDNLSQSALVDTLLLSPRMCAKAAFASSSTHTLYPIANILEYYQAQNRGAMSMEKSRELLSFLEPILDAVQIDREKMERENKYFSSNMVDVSRMPEFQDICEAMSSRSFTSLEQVRQLVTTMLENISERQVYASPYLLRNLVVILNRCARWYGGQTSLDWYVQAKPVIEFVLSC